MLDSIASEVKQLDASVKNIENQLSSLDQATQEQFTEFVQVDTVTFLKHLCCQDILIQSNLGNMLGKDARVCCCAASQEWCGGA